MSERNGHGNRTDKRDTEHGLTRREFVVAGAATSALASGA